MAVKKVGTLIREARTAKKLSQEQLASGIDGLSGSDIGKAERGEKEVSSGSAEGRQSGPRGFQDSFVFEDNVSFENNRCFQNGGGQENDDSSQDHSLFENCFVHDKENKRNCGEKDFNKYDEQIYERIFPHCRRAETD